MKKIFFLLIAFCLLISFSFAAFPAYTDLYVNDYAGIFSSEQISQLRNYLTQLRNETTAEAVVVTVNSFDGYAPIDYAVQLGQTWGVGKKETDNGLVIVYGKAENKIAVVTGYGLEGILPDSKVGRILDEYYVPNRDAGNVPQGIIDATLVYVNEIYKNKAEVGKTVSPTTDVGELIFSLIFFGIILIVFVGVLLIIGSSIVVSTVLNVKKEGIVKGLLLKVGLIGLMVLFFILGLVIPHPYGGYFNFAAIILLFILMGTSGFSGGHHSGGFGGGFHGGGGSFGGGGFGGGGASR
ncbi:MAG: TPM domain-containing protein [archaeon]